ncbi:MAG: hypothetical protein HC790_12965 [Acaryochloridaceae cyanobacterium CSU_3_4]|nr:hypothetical protein [Acaryochloridaceae cyanobacterium CSU_3_4]
MFVPGIVVADPRGQQQVLEQAELLLREAAPDPTVDIGLARARGVQNPEIAWQFRECIHGMSAACRALDVPVVSGNVSFYNETDGVSIPPTPSSRSSRTTDARKPITPMFGPFASPENERVLSFVWRLPHWKSAL